MSSEWQWSLITIEGYCLFETKVEEFPGITPPPFCPCMKEITEHDGIVCPRFVCLDQKCPHFGFCEADLDENGELRDPEAEAAEYRESMREMYE